MTSNRVERRLAAIFAADMVGYSRLMEIDEVSVIARQKNHREELIDPKIAAHDGRIVKLMGDGMLVEFASVVDAVQCGMEIQQEMAIREADVPEDRRICFRVGINLGDIIIDGDDILGDGVNIAARLEGLAEPGGVCISDVVHQSVFGKVDFAFKEMGEQKVKNIARPIRAFSILSSDRDMDSANAETTIEIAPTEKPSIAVLAFNNMSGDPEQEYFSDGLTEDIITGLSRIKDLLVIARNTSFTYKGKSVDVKQVGEELGVRYVLEGSVRKGGNRVRVTGQLIDTKTGGHVWADRYDGNLDDIFELQDNITAKVLTAVGTEINLAEIERSRHERSNSIDAWDRYLQALPLFYKIDKTSYKKVKTILEEVINIDPRFSSAYSVLAQCYVQAAFHGWETNAYEANVKAKELAQKATDLDSEDPAAHMALGWTHMLKTEHELSIKEFNKALELNPNYSAVNGLLSGSFGFLGRIDEAVEAFELALQGSPRDPERYLWYIGILNAYFAAERYEECVEAAENAIYLRPSFYGGYFIMAAALPFLGRVEDAKIAMQKARDLMPRLSLKTTARNPMYVRENDIKRLLEGLRQAGLPE